MPIILPRPNEIIPANLIDPRILLAYSAPKCGKTELFLQLTDSLLLDLEDGSGFANGTKITIAPCKDGSCKKCKKVGYYNTGLCSLGQLNDIGGQILKDGQLFKYIIVDTATELESWCEMDATLAYKASTIGKNFSGDSVLELPKGAGYHWLRMSYGKYFSALRGLPTKCLIVLAHVKDKMLVDKKGREVESTDLDLTGKLKQITCSRADAIGYIYRKVIGAEKGKQTEEIRINFHSSEINAGARAKHLAGRDIFLSNVVDTRVEKIEVNWKEIFIEN